MDADDCCKIVGIGCVIVFVIIMGASVSGKYTVYERTYYDLYTAEVPEGKFWIKTDGSFGFVLGCGGGSIETNLVESYTIKYWDDEGCLRSDILTAKDTLIKPDGTFRYELVDEYYYTNWLKIPSGNSWSPTRIIHVPYLPESSYVPSTESYMNGEKEFIEK